MNGYLCAGGGFLVAVIWMDLMFDVLALGRGSSGEVSQDSLAKIETYYRRVTTDAAPMNLLISAVMTSIVGVLAVELFGGSGRSIAAGSLLLCGVPIGLALGRVFPNAVRLGAAADPPAVRASLARSIAIDHLVCLSAMFAFVALRMFKAP
ncbi:MAG TPA: hypothetical protein VGK20_08800 [Candidatus Binatia bacterium]|jgi:hypothetical protein